jgi:hypothetical protein
MRPFRFPAGRALATITMKTDAIATMGEAIRTQVDAIPYFETAPHLAAEGIVAGYTRDIDILRDISVTDWPGRIRCVRPERHREIDVVEGAVRLPRAERRPLCCSTARHHRERTAQHAARGRRLSAATAQPVSVSHRRIQPEARPLARAAEARAAPRPDRTRVRTLSRSAREARAAGGPVVGGPAAASRDRAEPHGGSLGLHDRRADGGNRSADERDHLRDRGGPRARSRQGGAAGRSFRYTTSFRQTTDPSASAAAPCPTVPSATGRRASGSAATCSVRACAGNACAGLPRCTLHRA